VSLRSVLMHHLVSKCERPIRRSFARGKFHFARLFAIRRKPSGNQRSGLLVRLQPRRPAGAPTNRRDHRSANTFHEVRTQSAPGLQRSPVAAKQVIRHSGTRQTQLGEDMRRLRPDEVSGVCVLGVLIENCTRRPPVPHWSRWIALSNYGRLGGAVDRASCASGGAARNDRSSEPVAGVARDSRIGAVTYSSSVVSCKIPAPPFNELIVFAPFRRLSDHRARECPAMDPRLRE